MAYQEIGKFRTIKAKEFILLLELKLKTIYFKLQTYGYIDISVPSLKKDLRFIVDEILSLLPYKKCRMEMEMEQRVADIFSILRTVVHSITEYWDTIVILEFPEKKEHIEKLVRSSLYKLEAIKKLS
jgi:hypothetical protein